MFGYGTVHYVSWFVHAVHAKSQESVIVPHNDCCAEVWEKYGWNNTNPVFMLEIHAACWRFGHGIHTVSIIYRMG